MNITSELQQIGDVMTNQCDQCRGTHCSARNKKTERLLMLEKYCSVKCIFKDILLMFPKIFTSHCTNSHYMIAPTDILSPQRETEIIISTVWSEDSEFFMLSVHVYMISRRITFHTIIISSMTTRQLEK